MTMPGGGRRRTLLLAAGAVVLLAAGVALYLATRPPEGQIAVDFLAAIERGDLDEAGSLSWTQDGGRDALGDAIAPTYAWHPERIVETSPNDSAYDYDVTIETTSTDLTLSATTDLSFAIGTVDGEETLLDPLSEAVVTTTAELASLTVAGRDVDPATRLLKLLPGAYDVSGVTVDGVTVTGRLTVTTLAETPPTVALK